MEKEIIMYRDRRITEMEKDELLEVISIYSRRYKMKEKITPNL